MMVLEAIRHETWWLGFFLWSSSSSQCRLLIIHNVVATRWSSTVKQESLANAKVSARQPWYIWHNSLNHPHLHSSQSHRQQQAVPVKAVPFTGTPSNINVIYISLKITFIVMQQFRCWQRGSIFIRLAVVASEKCEVVQNFEKIWTVQGHSRSSILVPIESAYTTSY